MPYSKLIGPKLIQLATIWAPTGATFGAGATGVLLYMTDWKAVLQYVPIYGTKYRVDPPQ